MAKFTPYQKLSPQERQRVLLELCQTMVMVKRLEEAAKILGDLLSDQELLMVAKRLQIAKLLLNGKKYAQIRKDLKVSQQTIARVNLWLQQAGEGFRMVMKRGLAKADIKVPEWMPPIRRSEMARRFPLHYWPRGLLEQIMRAANNRQRKQMLATLQVIREAGKGKREVFCYLEELLRVERQSPRRAQQLEKEMQLGKVDSDHNSKNSRKKVP